MPNYPYGPDYQVIGALESLDALLARNNLLPEGAPASILIGKLAQ